LTAHAADAGDGLYGQVRAAPDNPQVYYRPGRPGRPPGV